MKTRINELCKAVGITTAYQLQKATGLSPSQAARLYKDDVEAISLSVMEILCNAFKCTPNDLFGYETDFVPNPTPSQVIARLEKRKKIKKAKNGGSNDPQK